MTDVELLTKLKSFYTDLLTAPRDTIVAKWDGNQIRINHGHLIQTIQPGLINFRSRYQLISKFTMKKVIEECSNCISLAGKFYCQLTPKSWGYKVKFYDGLNVIMTKKIECFTTNSPILCYWFLVKNFIKPS